MKQFIAVAISLAVLSACSGNRHELLNSLPVSKASARSLLPGAGRVCSKPVSIPVANRMIRSYLSGIDASVNTDAVRSWEVSADTLRSYLSGDRGTKIVRLKLMLAHTMAYIHSGNEGRREPLNSHDVTIVMVGVDKDNNLVYNDQYMPYDYAMPCPPECLGGGGNDTDDVIGTAALDTLYWQ
jgi:hypothetical protein